MRLRALPLGLALLVPSAAWPCTNILVSRGAAQDGSTMITYAADSHELYGELVLRAPGKHLAGTMIEIIDWDDGHRRGEIEQVAETFSVVGNMNEHQLVIGETTFGGREELVDPTGIIDYGSLIYLALQRAKTARQAIQVMTDLVAQYGYGSSGESFSIADAQETWLLEMIGKGPGRTGAVWVARRLPEGMISAHANQARIRQFPLNDPANTIYAQDVIQFARERGYFKGKDADFSFADAYAPLDFGAARFCEARVWSVFRRAAPSLALSSDYAAGKPGATPLPLWIKPDRKLSARDVIELMRDHFEDTPFDMRHDVGAGPFHLPYRWRPMVWEHEGKKYLHERAISTQQTGWSYVSQSRAWLPGPIGGLQWFGVDDTYSTVYVPIYAGLRRAPPSFAPGVASLHRFSWQSAFWVFNWVANFAYGRYQDIIRDIQVVQRELEGDFFARQPEIEAAAQKLYAESPELARDYLTAYSTEQAERTVNRWRALGEALLVKYVDGNVKDEKGQVTHPRYPDDWYARIVADRGAELLITPLPGEAEREQPITVTGYVHSRAELGELGSEVPLDFPFEREKLVLLPGKNRCGHPPRCCATAQPNPAGDRLLVTLPEGEPEKCGAPSWWLRLGKDERRPLFFAD